MQGYLAILWTNELGQIGVGSSAKPHYERSDLPTVK